MAEDTLDVISLIYREIALKDKLSKHRYGFTFFSLIKRVPCSNLSFIAPMKSKSFTENIHINDKFYRETSKI